MIASNKRSASPCCVTLLRTPLSAAVFLTLPAVFFVGGKAGFAFLATSLTTSIGAFLEVFSLELAATLFLGVLTFFGVSFLGATFFGAAFLASSFLAVTFEVAAFFLPEHFF